MSPDSTKVRFLGLLNLKALCQTSAHDAFLNFLYRYEFKFPYNTVEFYERPTELDHTFGLWYLSTAKFDITDW